MILDYFLIFTILVVVIYTLKQLYTNLIWNKTYWVCEECSKECKASETFGNILDDNSNWNCYGCNHRNYSYVRILK